MKTAAVALISAVFAFTAQEPNSLAPLVALVPALVFWGLDAYYLRREKRYRKFYDAVRTGPDDGHPVPPFSMDSKPYDAGVPGWLRTCFTGKLIGLYGPLAALTVVLSLIHHRW